MFNKIIKYFVYGIISLIYNLLFYQISKFNYNNVELENNGDKQFTTLIVGATVGLILSKILYEKNTKINNDTLSNGLYIGSILMCIFAIGDHWYDMSNEIKIFILFVSLVWFIIIIYKKFPNEEDKVYNLKQI
jgi:hypothetical protein